MATYFMFGRYSLDAIEEISVERTDEAIALIEKHGGVLESGYALQGDNREAGRCKDTHHAYHYVGLP